PQTGIPGIHHSTFESLRVGRSSQSIASNLFAYEIQTWNVVEKIRYVQGSDLSKETTRVVIRLLIDL
ncbi:hypothetical protein HID58_014838, partial [Brassica napus]